MSEVKDNIRPGLGDGGERCWRCGRSAVGCEKCGLEKWIKDAEKVG